MKIIFLDIYGVLNSKASFKKRKKIGYEFNHKDPLNSTDCPSNPMIKYLNDILDATKAKIVISSSWRHFHSLIEIRQMFINCGIKGDLLGSTPSVKLSGNRGMEIQAWIDYYNVCRKEDSSMSIIEAFVILDDNEDMGTLINKLIKTDEKIGLTKENAETAIKSLNTIDF